MVHVCLIKLDVDIVSPLTRVTHSLLLADYITVSLDVDIVSPLTRVTHSLLLADYITVSFGCRYSFTINPCDP